MPDDKIKISALPSALAFNNTDEFAIVQDNGGSKTTKKGTVQGLGSHIAETMNFSSELDTDSNSIIGAINEAASDKNLAEPYSSTSFYLPGDYCIYNTVLYKCTAASAMEDFDPTKWDEVLITEELGGDMSSKMDKANPTGTGSLAVGSSVSASGNNSTALGTSNTASGGNSHAEGFGTTASALAAHAENDHTTASGASSHAEGYGTIANHASQHVFGECNVADPSSAAATARGNFVEIVGNGANTNNRSNARTLGWDGTETLAADLVFNNATTPQSLTSELQNRYTKAQVNAIIDSILPTDSTGKVASATFKTSYAKPIDIMAYIEAVQASGTPTPSSPLPISGWSQVEITRCGANLCNQAEIVSAYPSKYTVDTDGSIKTVGNLGLSNVLWTNKSKVSGVLNVIFVSKYQNTGSVGIRPKIIYTDGTNSVVYPTNTQDYSTKTLLTASGKTVEKIVVDYGTNNPTNFFLDVTLDTSATTYEAYNGIDVTIDLDGTRYGGYVTQDKDGQRKLVNTYRAFTIDNTLSAGQWYEDLKQYYYSGILSSYPAKYISNQVSYLCDKLKPVSFDYRANNIGNFISLIGSGSGIGLSIPNCNTQAEAEAFIANNSIQFVYELATPIVINLPDGQPLNALIGTNNIWADTGDVDVSFKCSVEDYVNAHAGSGNRSLGVSLSKGSGNGEDPEELDEKTLIDDEEESGEIKPISKK